MIATPLSRKGGPLYRVECPVCGRFLGSLYRDGASLRAFAVECTQQCKALWEHARGKSGWRDLPPDLRQVQLAAWKLDQRVNDE